VYDMYPWNDPDSVSRGDDPPIPPRSFSRGDPSPRTPLGRDPSPQSPLVRAVQFALDRRDNGGDALAAAGRPMSQPPAEPAAGRTRQ